MEAESQYPYRDRIFDHMLNSFARHGFFDLDLQVEGDLEVDTHHTIEDTGIVLGQAIRQAVGDKKRHLPVWFPDPSHGRGPCYLCFRSLRKTLSGI